MATEFNIADLIKESAPAQVGQTKNDFQLVPLEALVENKKNDLFPIQADELDDLTNSIHAIGLSEPLTVTPQGDKFLIISGHRRSRAYKKLRQERPTEEKWKTIPCYIRRYASEEDAELALIMANTLVRQDKSWIAPAARRVEELLKKKMERDGVKYRGKMQMKIAEVLQISRQNLQRQMFIDDHLDQAVKRRWPNLSTQVAGDIAHMSSDIQRMIAERWPEWLGVPSHLLVGEAETCLKIGEDWFMKQEIRHQRKLKEAAEEEEKRQQHLKEIAKLDKDSKKKKVKKIRCGMSCDNGWIPETECSKETAKNCTENKACCIGCNERFFCNHVCNGVRKRMEEGTEAAAKKIAQRARAVREKSSVSVGIHPLEMNNFPVMMFRHYLVDFAYEYGCSTDYLLGLTDVQEPVDVFLNNLQNPNDPAAQAPKWQRITDGCQPESGSRAEVVTWIGDKWFGGAVTWHCDLFNPDLIQMWCPAIPRPEPPEEEEEEETLF